MYKNNKMEREENEYKLGGDENNIFFTQTTTFHITIWMEKKKNNFSQMVERLILSTSLQGLPH